jgi:hypothetical protein
MDRFETNGIDPTGHAQVNLEGVPEPWSAVTMLVERVGPAIVALIHRGAIGRPIADVALHFFNDRSTCSAFIPNNAAIALGRWGFDIQISVHRSAPARDGEDWSRRQPARVPILFGHR